MQDALIILVIFSVPLTAILSRTWLKAQQLKLEKGGGSDTERRLLLLERENAALQQRVETLETIATGGDERSLGIEAAHKLKQLEGAVHEEARRK